MKRTHLSVAIALACCLSTGVAMAQSTTDQASDSQNTSAAAQRNNPSSTSNTTTSNDTRRAVQLSTVKVTAQSLALGGGLMSVQTAPKAVSTITRDAIVQSAPGATFVQMIDSVPGVNASTDDVTGLANGNYSVRGFTSDEIGTTVNGAPINDSGNYKVYSTEYGDTENMGDITVLQGYPDVDTPISGAAGGAIAWVTIDPSHTAGLDFSQTFGSNDYRRTFFRLNTGDTGPVRSWISYSNNTADFWRGTGTLDVTKVDGKSVWTIDDNNSISASLQYNREANYSYDSLTKSQAQQNYFQSYDRTLASPTDTYFWKLHTNPFRSWLVSLDGEFKLSDSLRLSVVPYFQYGNGGSGGGSTFYETTSKNNEYQDTNQDLNGDGVLKGKDLAYSYSQGYTMRPGVIAKLNQDFGQDNSLEYGVWWDRPREEQSQVFTPTAPDGTPADVWGQTDLIRYPNGQIQKAYDNYTLTDTRKVFATDTWTPNDQLTITAGLSYLWEKRSGFADEYPGATYQVSKTSPDTQFGYQGEATFHKFSPSAGIKYQLNDENQFYFGAGRTFRAPINSSIFLNGAVGDAPANAKLASSSFSGKPETATTFDLGWRFYNDTFSANVDAYESHLNNKQISGYDNITGESVYLSLPQMHMRGVTGETSYKVTENWTVYANYTYQRTILEGDINTLDDGIYNTKGKTFLNAPKNAGFVRVNFKQGPFWANLDAKYRGAVWGDWSNTQQVGGYTTFNLGTGVHLDDFSTWFRQPYIKFNIFNLTDRRALTNANNITAFLATNPNKTKDENGTVLYASEPYYSLLQDRTYMITFGASFF